MPFQICDVRWLTTLSPGATDPSESCNKGAVILIYKKPELNNIWEYWFFGDQDLVMALDSIQCCHQSYSQSVKFEYRIVYYRKP